MMMLKESPITIVLTRASVKDDYIRILPHSEKEGVFSVEYEDRWSGYSYYFEDSWNEVEAYLAQIFAVLPLDCYPFQSVQFNLPAYPSICIRPQETTRECVMEPIWAMIETVARGWPVTTKSPHKNA